jgi:hypothetical protein
VVIAVGLGCLIACGGWTDVSQHPCMEVAVDDPAVSPENCDAPWPSATSATGSVVRSARFNGIIENTITAPGSCSYDRQTLSSFVIAAEDGFRWTLDFSDAAGRSWSSFVGESVTVSVSAACGRSFSVGVQVDHNGLPLVWGERFQGDRVRRFASSEQMSVERGAEVGSDNETTYFALRVAADGGSREVKATRPATLSAFAHSYEIHNFYTVENNCDGSETDCSDSLHAYVIQRAD